MLFVVLEGQRVDVSVSMFVCFCLCTSLSVCIKLSNSNCCRASIGSRKLVLVMSYGSLQCYMHVQAGHACNTTGLLLKFEVHQASTLFYIQGFKIKTK